MPSEVSGFRRPSNQKNRGTLNHVALYLSSYAPFDSHVIGDFGDYFCRDSVCPWRSGGADGSAADAGRGWR